MEWQLRDYAIREGHLDDFVADWTATVLPLRKRFGFEVVAWSVPDESRFVWLLGYDGPEGLEAADTAYYASPERAALSPDPVRWLQDRRHARAIPHAWPEDRGA